MIAPKRFPCPSCQSEHVHVHDSRQRADFRTRRYHCQSCGNRFNTVEMQVTAGDEFHVRTTGRGTTIVPMVQWLTRRVARAKIALEDALKGA